MHGVLLRVASDLGSWAAEAKLTSPPLGPFPSSRGPGSTDRLRFKGQHLKPGDGVLLREATLSGTRPAAHP